MGNAHLITRCKVRSKKKYAVEIRGAGFEARARRAGFPELRNFYLCICNWLAIG